MSLLLISTHPPQRRHLIHLQSDHTYHCHSLPFFPRFPVNSFICTTLYAYDVSFTSQQLHNQFHQRADAVGATMPGVEYNWKDFGIHHPNPKVFLEPQVRQPCHQGESMLGVARTTCDVGTSTNTLLLACLTLRSIAVFAGRWRFARLRRLPPVGGVLLRLPRRSPGGRQLLHGKSQVARLLLHVVIDRPHRQRSSAGRRRHDALSLTRGNR